MYIGKCPYCYKHFDMDHDDVLWDDEDEQDVICESCGKGFVVSTYITVGFNCVEKEE